MFSNVVINVAAAFIVLLALFILAITTLYVKAPPNVAYIISGFRKEPRILIGSGGIKLPFVERLDRLYIGQLSVDIKTSQSVPTNDFINVNVEAVSKVAVGRDITSLQLAAKNFLNMGTKEIIENLADSLEGNMREIIGTLSLKDINTDRDSFSEQVVQKAAKDMSKLGVEIISCNIQNVTDEAGLICDLGADNTAKIKKDAAISKAQADRDVKIAQAAAEKEANDARVKADLEIANRQTELSIKRSELKKNSDIKRAEADAAYSIQEQEQNSAIQKATVNAQIAKAERDQELREKEVKVKEQELNASIQKQADADKYKVEQEAAAQLERRKREAEAELYEQEKAAAAKKAQAEALKFSMEQEAAGIRAKGEANAAAIRAKGEAEAAAMDKKADAMQKYGKAALAQMVVEILPQVATEVARPLAGIDKISIIGGGNAENGIISPVAANVPVVMAQTFQAVKEATGIDLNDIIKGQSYDAKVTRNVNVSGLEEKVEDQAMKTAVLADAINEGKK